MCQGSAFFCTNQGSDILWKQRGIKDTRMHAWTCTKIFIGTRTCDKPLRSGWKLQLGEKLWHLRLGSTLAVWGEWPLSLETAVLLGRADTCHSTNTLLKLAAAGSSCRSAQQLSQAYLSVSSTDLHKHNTALRATGLQNMFWRHFILTTRLFISLKSKQMWRYILQIVL